MLIIDYVTTQGASVHFARFVQDVQRASISTRSTRWQALYHIRFRNSEPHMQDWQAINLGSRKFKAMGNVSFLENTST